MNESLQDICHLTFFITIKIIYLVLLAPKTTYMHIHCKGGINVKAVNEQKHVMIMCTWICVVCTRALCYTAYNLQ